MVEWARGRGALLLEDDYDAELRYDHRGPAGTLQGLAPDIVVLAGSVSKTLAPALRLGWLCLPGEAVAAATLARARYREKRAVLLAALAAELPAARVRGIAAGLHAVLELPAGVEEARVVERAGAAGIRVQGLTDFTRGNPARPRSSSATACPPPASCARRSPRSPPPARHRTVGAPGMHGGKEVRGGWD